MKPLFHCVIPARHGSTRLPGKPLLDIAGLPMIERVRQAAAASAARSVIVATDHEEIRARVAAAGGEVCLTAADHASGTDRLAEVARQRGWADDAIVVNVQGDEPLLPAAVINQVAANLAAHPECGVATLCEPITDAETLDAFAELVAKVQDLEPGHLQGVDDEPDPAGVLLLFRVIKALLRWKPGYPHHGNLVSLGRR